jgi:S-adenosylmethionine hydrolase
VFTPFLLEPGWRAFELRAPDYRRPDVSRTFHGRDVFAPAAGYLAAGVPPERFGPEVTDPVRLPWPDSRPIAGGRSGEVIHVDWFGNLMTSIRARDLPADARVDVGGRELRVVGTYADALPNEVVALVSSGGRLEIAVREGSAAVALGAGRGAPVTVRERPASASSASKT